MQSKCLQPKVYANLPVEFLFFKKGKRQKRKKKDKKKPESFLMILSTQNWQAYGPAQVRGFHTTRSEFRFIDFHRMDLKNGTKLTARKGPGESEVKMQLVVRVHHLRLQSPQRLRLERDFVFVNQVPEL